MASQYPIRAVSQLTGLGLDTLRAWERRYRAVQPVRGQRGRLYGEEEIRRLRLLRGAVDAGHAIGQIAPLTDAELEGLQRPTPAGENAVIPKRLQIVLDAIYAYDSESADEELGRLALLLKTGDLVHQVVTPLMRLAGERWEQRSFRVAHEHLLSASIRSLLGALIRRQEIHLGAGKVVLATPAGEMHEFGILAAAMLAVAHHFEVAYLGPNLPAEDILDAAAALRPRAVVAGIMDINVTPAARAGVAQLAQELPDGTELWLGGTGARKVTDASWGNAVVLEGLQDFERHLERLRS